MSDLPILKASAGRGWTEKGRLRVKRRARVGEGWFNGSQEEGWCLAGASVSGRLYSSR